MVGAGASGAMLRRPLRSGYTVFSQTESTNALCSSAGISIMPGGQLKFMGRRGVAKGNNALQHYKKSVGFEFHTPFLS